MKADRRTSELGLQSLLSTIGNCERIVKTSVPLSYSVHTSRFLSLWSFSLPFVLVNCLGSCMTPIRVRECL